ncbi:hypothetical protein L665_01208 [Ralstonia solanacearum SD54]|nr:hypothetical protein L665_01208 [Ralstonia solanacearum SD54]
MHEVAQADGLEAGRLVAPASPPRVISATQRCGRSVHR